MQEKDFIGYEYKTVSVKAKDRTKATDMYEAFGWEITNAAPAPFGGTALSMKRDRHIRHRQELNKLQRRAEDAFASVNGLERAKTLGARIFACIFGCFAALVLGGGMSLTMCIQDSIPAMAGGIALGIIGIALCIVNYFLYQKIAARKSAALLSVIDEAEEEFANILEQGNELLHTELI